MSQENNNPSFKAVLLTPPSKVLFKNNAAKSQYVIYNAEITEEGPMKGKTITGAFTLSNAKGETKSAPSKGEEVLVYVSVVNNKPLFEIGGARVETTSDEDILASLALMGLSTANQAI